MKQMLLLLVLIIFTPGCANIPLRPKLDQKLDNQNGEIDDIKNNQNGLMLDLIELKNKQDITARDVENFQQGLVNKNNENTGIQIFQGDGGIVAGIAIIGILSIILMYYRNQSVKNKKVAKILAQQVKFYNDTELTESVYISALNTDVEKDIYYILKH